MNVKALTLMFFFPWKILLGIIRSQGTSIKVGEKNTTFEFHRPTSWPNGKGIKC